MPQRRPRPCGVTRGALGKAVRDGAVRGRGAATGVRGWSGEVCVCGVEQIAGAVVAQVPPAALWRETVGRRPSAVGLPTPTGMGMAQVAADGTTRRSQRGVRMLVGRVSTPFGSGAAALATARCEALSSFHAPFWPHRAGRAPGSSTELGVPATDVG